MMKRWKIVVLVIGALIVGGAAYVGYAFFHAVNTTVPNAYAVWWVADMVIDHMKANDGAWPRSWDELRDDFDTTTSHAAHPWEFSELQTRVVVDWQADPRELMAAAPRDDGLPFRVIWLSDGSGVYWAGQEPNQMIFVYLRQRTGHPSGAQLQ